MMALASLLCAGLIVINTVAYFLMVAAHNLT
jgi:hypothetical protein